jgi:hypothetical protein
MLCRILTRGVCRRCCRTVALADRLISCLVHDAGMVFRFLRLLRKGNIAEVEWVFLVALGLSIFIRDEMTR